MAGDDFGEMLDIERIDRDLYRARSFAGPDRPNLFGGEVAAQALRAATLSVPDDRRPHSLHGYFLRRGTAGPPIVLQVHRDRDGGSFSSRRILAIQNGEVLFSAAASFQVPEEGPDYQLPMPTDMPAPDAASLEDAAGGPGELFEIRAVITRQSGARQGGTRRLWTRTRVALPDDSDVHACALVYVTDFGSGFADVDLQGLARGGPSLDHCVWFHHPIRLDDWVLLDLWPLRASAARGTYMGTVHDRQGVLGGVLTQEALLRPREPSLPLIEK